MTTTKFEIIPAIDLMDGKCVRLEQGNFHLKKMYNEQPLDQALRFEDAGLVRLHLVDLDGAKAGTLKNLRVLETIAAKTNLKVDFGGGIQSTDALKAVFDSGACMAAVGSIAVKDPELFYSWLELVGADRLFLGADVKERKIKINGWLQETSLDVFEFIESFVARGVRRLFVTDISKDGLLQGPSSELYRDLLMKIQNWELTASGGVKDIADLYTLKELGCSGVIIGKAFYEGRIRLNELNDFIR